MADKIVFSIFQGKKIYIRITQILLEKINYNKPEVAKEKLIDKHANRLTILWKTLITYEISTIKEKQSKS